MMEGRVCIVTGSGQGLGRAFALHFASLGAVSVIAEINAANCQSVAAEIIEAGGKALAIETDVADSGSVRAMAERTLAEYGRIDVLVNNAAILQSISRVPVDQISDEEWDKVIRVNVTGAFYCVRAVVPAMREAGWGRIINLSSDTVLLPPPLTYAHYITSKAALVGLTRELARELGPDGITVNAIMPGSTETEVEQSAKVRDNRANIVVPRQCIPRVEVAEDLVGAAAFLASDAAGFITGQSLPVNGGIAFV
ncbi:MAG: SDR family oxidoreductase [Rhodospirillales bacterium]|jgi:3-oxoacyl-[acyl-carrier protein] reductase|nr:SDR family oxidoreductase [Rhodospirillales bacterium]MDP6843756.1 SDR family oxidoreductase [Rhodospirillales bacterium]|tara:strand:+ start:165 stop:923 length:759 start_codon:yes stop_codon:yes gene_type:complete